MSNESIPEDQQETLEDVESPALAGGSSAVLAAADWTTQTMLDQLRRGNIDLNPLFQRRDAWRPERKSQFIESLVLGLPVPQLVLAERKEKRGSYIVIDGKQRLLTLRQFAADKDSEFESLKLQGLRVRKDLNGLTYSALRERPDLDSELTAFENQTIRTVVIRNWPSEDFLYTVFLRLNTGSVPLSPQELRQALHPGSFSSFINEYPMNNKTIRGLLGITGPDFRMRDTELVIRYLAFRNFLEKYTGNLKLLLDITAFHFNKDWSQNQPIIEMQLSELEKAIQITNEIFGPDNAFRKWNGEAFESRINRAVFDVMVQYFVDTKVIAKALTSKGAVVEAFKSLCENDADFRSSIEGTTKSLDAIVTRLESWGNKLGSVLGMKMRTPRLEGKKITF